MAKKATLLKTLTLIFVLCLAACVFTACSSHVHEFNYSVTAPATCVESGSMFGVCSCGKTTTITTSKTEHNFVNGACSFCGFNKGSQDQPCSHSWQEADCLTPKTCLECGAVEGEPLGHDFFDNACKNCGFQATPAGYFNFKLLEDGTYEITAKDVDDMSAEVVIPSSYNGKAVAVIGEEAFFNCESLTSIEIPDSITSIGDYAFFSCDSLTSVVIGNSVTSIGSYAFFSCDSLTSVVIGNSVTSIGSYAFYGCSSLTSVVIGNSVTSIGASAFASCISLTSVVIPNSVTSIGASAFASCSSLTSVVIPNSVTSIGASAFKYCISLTSVVIPNSVTSIGTFAFYDCESLQYNVKENLNYLGNETNPYLYLSGVTSQDITSANIDNCCKFIGNSAFNSCYRLTSVVIPDSVTSIGYGAFYCCISLTSIVISDSVTSIGDRAFEDCYKLVEVINKSRHITISKGSSSNGCVGYYALSVSNRDDSYVSKLNTDENGYITYSDGLEVILVGYIGSEKDLILSSNITKIYKYAFASCYSLTSVVIGDSVTAIGDWAFSGCSSLTSIEIPNSVTSIGNLAFGWCGSLTSIEYRGTEEEWNAISKGTVWDFGTGNYTITYNYIGE